MAAADERGNKKHFWKPCSFCFYLCGKMCKKYLKNSIVSSAKVVFLYFFLLKRTTTTVRYVHKPRIKPPPQPPPCLKLARRSPIISLFDILHSAARDVVKETHKKTLFQCCSSYCTFAEVISASWASPLPVSMALAKRKQGSSVALRRDSPETFDLFSRG